MNNPNDVGKTERTESNITTVIEPKLNNNPKSNNNQPPNSHIHVRGLFLVGREFLEPVPALNP